MKKFFAHILLFFICFGLLLAGYTTGATFIMNRCGGPDSAQQILKSFSDAVTQEYSCYFLGNSRIYRGINPACFTGVLSYNFAHDNDTYNQMYYKLLYLEKTQSPDYLVIGTDYFQFSFLDHSLNYIYTPLLGSAYQQDYIDGPRTVASVLREAFSDFIVFWGYKRPDRALRLNFEAYLKKTPVTNVPFLKENGQYIRYNTATPEDTVTRDDTILNIQWEYFLKIIENCRENDIELFVIMPPTRDAELDSYTPAEMAAFDRKIEEALGTEGHYLNYCNLPEFKDYTKYQDITHLTPTAADQFSTYLSNQLPFSA